MTYLFYSFLIVIPVRRNLRELLHVFNLKIAPIARMVHGGQSLTSKNGRDILHKEARTKEQKQKKQE